MVNVFKKLTLCLVVSFIFLFLLKSSQVFAVGNLTELGIFTGEAIGDSFGYPNNYSPIGVADINEDGIDDVLVGARYHEPSGGLYIFLGGDGIGDDQAINADIILRDDEDTAVGDSGFGEAFSTGDLDGDGNLELLVGNYRHDIVNHNEGAAYIFKIGQNFSSRGVSQSEARTIGLQYRQSLSVPARILGDLNNDGFDDYVLAGLNNDFKFHIYYGSSVLSNRTIDQDDVTISDLENKCIFNYMIPKGADLNKDGYTDLIIGCAYAGQNVEGAIYVFYGGSTLVDKDVADADVIINSATGSFGFGSNVATGDIDKDGLVDLLSTTQDKAYVFLGSSGWTNRSISNANVAYSSDPNYPDCNYVSYAEMFDINIDERPDVVMANSCSGKINVIYGDSYLENKDASQGDLVFDGPSNIRFGDPMVVGDINADGYPDINTGAGDYNSRQGQVYLLTSPHGAPTIRLNDIGNTNNLTFTGTAVDGFGVGAVEASIDGASWHSCSFVSGNFSCNLSLILADGSHSVRLRSKNNLGVYMATKEYTSASFTYDRSSPLVDWKDNSGNIKKYESQGGNNVYTEDTLPTFSFSKSSDISSGISKYQILVNNNLHIDNIDPYKPADKDYREDDDKYVKYDGDIILVHAKKDSNRLLSGKAYKWKVRAVDSANNVADSSEKILRVSTHEANFSGVFFPISLLSIGGKNANISTLNFESEKSIFSVFTHTPTLYGIAPIGATVSMKVEKENNAKDGRDLVFSATSTANEFSRFGINITEKLENQKYFISLSAINSNGDYAEMPEFVMLVKDGISNPAKSSSQTFESSAVTNGTNVKNVPEVMLNIEQKKESEGKQKKKLCILWWCW